MSADVDPVLSVGQRIKHFRTRTGMSSPVLAGMIGKSAEWLKAVENGRLQTPRLSMLLRIAEALELDDLALLTGNGVAVPVQLFAGSAHAALPAVQAALTDYRITPPAGSQVPKIDRPSRLAPPASLAGAAFQLGSPDQTGSPSARLDSRRTGRSTYSRT